MMRMTERARVFSECQRKTKSHQVKMKLHRRKREKMI